MKALLILSALAFVWGTREIEESEVTRGEITQCPSQAVCADIFEYNQTDPDTGVRTPKRRRVINCFCPNSDTCPNTKRNTLHASPRHRQQICEQRNTLQRCKNGRVAEEMHVNSEDFAGRTYYKILCRCPRHRNPPSTGGFRERSTVLLGQVFVEDHWIHNYVCVRDRHDRRRRPRN